ncbi:hypothetical protein D920_02150 [Enterococcus faecalis 13-SD-W-01]|nr:hypothetical protein D920_02150 [Enterococcus faecalis 13-SD-W-01]
MFTTSHKRCSRTSFFDINSKKQKIGEAILYFSSLLLEAERFFHNLYLTIEFLSLFCYYEAT